MQHLILNRRKLWTMSCETLFQNFAASLNPELITKLCRKHHIPLPSDTRGQVALFQLAHEHCHCDSTFAREIQRYLNRKHTVLIAQLTPLGLDGLRSTIDTLLLESRAVLPNTLPGVLWAVCSDPRGAVRPLEKLLIDELHFLSHGLLLAQFQGRNRMIGLKSTQVSTELESLQDELAKLKTEHAELQHHLQRLQRDQSRVVQDKIQLQHKLNAQEKRCLALLLQGQTAQSPDSPPSVTPRELKKMRYELAKLTATLREKEDETQRLSALVSFYESQTANPASGARAREQASRPEREWPSINLNGKKVALIGGLAKAAIHYEQAIRQLGGSCVRHNGNANQGDKKLTKIIRQADVVFCPVDCVSHGTVSSAKKLCRVLQKPCYFLRSSGISYIREKLREVAQDA